MADERALLLAVAGKLEGLRRVCPCTVCKGDPCEGTHCDECWVAGNNHGDWCEVCAGRTWTPAEDLESLHRALREAGAQNIEYDYDLVDVLVRACVLLNERYYSGDGEDERAALLAAAAAALGVEEAARG